ncbi:MAG: glycosyltransferase family 2 protein [Cyclobacteriaceae bacterium]|nr:glycosyltransferase family 2 protein [Cyclobacteriaceae bacterium]
MNGVSVIICCYNSASRLANTLQHLALQEVPVDLPWEVIIVNNASTDDTAAVALREWNRHSTRATFQVVDEPVSGLSSARSRGVAVARFEYFIFCDDDNWLASNFVQCAFDTMTRHPQVGAACGTGVPATEGELPVWFEKYQGGYAVGRPAEQSGDVSHLRALTGAALVSRKTLFEKAYAIHPALLTDRKGSAMTSGGDSEYTMRLLLMGYSLYFDDRLSFTHFIPSFRLTETYRDQLFKGFRSAAPVLELYLFQITVKFNSTIDNLILLAKSMLRLVILTFMNVGRWSRERELTWIFQLTGWYSNLVSEECRGVRKFYKQFRYPA